MRQLSPDPLSLAAVALDAGVSLLTVTLGQKGVAYVAAPGFDGLAAGPRGRGAAGPDGVTLSEAKGPKVRSTQNGGGAAVRTALIPAPDVETLDPTGCGDVFGAAAVARLLAGDSVETALRHAAAMGSRNAAFRGASGLPRHLRGELVTP